MSPTKIVPDHFLSLVCAALKVYCLKDSDNIFVQELRFTGSGPANKIMVLWWIVICIEELKHAEFARQPCSGPRNKFRVSPEE